MLRLIERNASWPKLAVAAIVSGVVWYLMLGVEADFSNSVGKPTSPDFAVMISNLYEYAEVYSAGAIDFYLARFVPLDMIFPALLGLVIALALTLSGAPRLVVLVPFIAVAADYFENGLIIAVLLTADAPVAGLGVLASLLTKIKFGAYGLAGLALILTLFRRAMSQ